MRIRKMTDTYHAPSSLMNARRSGTDFVTLVIMHHLSLIEFRDRGT